MPRRLPTPPEPAARFHSTDWFLALASLLTLLTFVVAQSVYELLAANQVFLTLRQVSNGHLLVVIAIFNWLPALALFLLWGLLRRLHHGLARSFLSGIYFLLFLALFLQIHNAYLKDWQPFPSSYALWILPAALLGLAPLRFERVFRSFVLALSPVVLLFPALFLFRTWTDQAVPRQPARATQGPAVAPLPPGKLPPVFLLVLDELTLPLLLDPAGQIDGARFPNFSALARQSYWFRNATANADQTIFSLPQILTGELALRGAPTFAYYPQNLLALLEPRYRVYVYESFTRFCDPLRHRCLAATRQGAAGQLDLLRDILYLYAARVLPPGLDLGLPDVRKTWGPFADPGSLLEARLERFEKVMDTLASLEKDENVFLFFHHLLPHAPYLLSVEGRVLDLSPDFFDPRLRGNRATLEKVFRQYESQTIFVDKQLGRFLARLRQFGLYDRSLLIVTADHGVSYRPEAPGRVLTRVNGVPANADLILSIPLFIKLPSQTRGEISDRDAQLIDIVPTVADVLHLEVPWPYSGRSVFAGEAPPRNRIAFDPDQNRFEFPPGQPLCCQPLPRDYPH